jgi:hypothetical protein
MLTQTLTLVAVWFSGIAKAPIPRLDSLAVRAVVVVMVNVPLLGLFFRDSLIRVAFCHSANFLFLLTALLPSQKIVYLVPQCPQCNR